MGKSIRMQRNELVWETRVSYFEKEDWDKVVAWLKNFDKEDVDPYTWEGHQRNVYHAIKDLSFEDVIADFEKYESSYEDNGCIQIKQANRNYLGEIWEYVDFLHDLVLDWMREDNYESDVCSSEYADDYEEYVNIMED